MAAADGNKRRIPRYLITAGIQFAVLLGLLGLGVASILGPDQFADFIRPFAWLVLIDLPSGLFLGFLAIVFWFPACRMLNWHGRDSFPLVLLTGTAAGWLFGILIGAWYLCVAESIGAFFLWSLELFVGPVYLGQGSQSETETLEPCMREFKLVSRVTLQSTLGSGIWTLVYWNLAVLPNKERHGSKSDSDG